MLPMRVIMQNLGRAFREDVAFRNRMLGFVVATTLVVGAFATGFELELRFGRDRGAGLVAGEGVDAASNGSGGGGRGGVAFGGQRERAVGATEGLAAGRSGSAGAGASVSGPDDGPAIGGTGNGAVAAARPECAAANLQATDQGVSEDTIKIGVLKAELGNLSELGFAAGVAADYERIMDAWTAHVNAQGGVACRQVTYVAEHFDVLSVDDMIAKCRSMTQDHKVFAVLTSGGYDSVGQLCIARDNQTPLINTEPQPQHWYQEAAPYLWATLMNKDRTHRNHVRWLVEHGEIDRGTRIGVVYHGIPNVGPAVERSLLVELARHGIEPVRVTRLSADSEQALAQISQVVVDFQARGVEYVFMPMNLIFKTQFMTQAEQQNYFPRYTDSDHYFGCFDFVTGTYPARSWDGTTCVTASQVAGMRPADLEAFADAHPWQQHADAVYLAHNPGGFGEGDSGDAQRAMNSVMGTLFTLWAEAADRAGPDLTRASWGREMGNTGSFDKHTAPHPLTFSHDKWDGPDHIHAVRWHAQGGDGYEPRMYRMLTAPQPAYY